jgi:hypothetical protein
MTAEVNLRTQAMANTALAALFGSGSPLIFRWFDTQLPQGYIQSGTCVRVLRVSTNRTYSFAGIQNMSWIRFQIDVLDADPEQARAGASAIIGFLGAVSLGNIPTQYANFLLNQRGGMDFQLQPPVFVQTLDVRLWNLEPTGE